MSDKNSTEKNWTSWHHLLHKEILRNKTLIPKGSNILIAVSGGQDSMALLHLINDLKEHHNWSISVWHGDHQWHEQSSIYALQLKIYCKEKNISFFSDKANKENICSEARARDWRYRKLNEKAKSLLIEKQLNNFYILTGHTSTDNAETFILNLSRGSNYAGLSNMESKRLLDNHIFLIRPILIFSREETKQFCKIMDIPVWEDNAINIINYLTLSYPDIPGGFELSGIYPNPFNPSTTINFSVSESMDLKLVIYDMQGRAVQTLLDKDCSPGSYNINWNANGFASGVYFAKLSSVKHEQVYKLMLIK